MEIGLTRASSEQGWRTATEAVDGLLRHAFTAMNTHRVVAVTGARNSAAAGLLTRVGMRQEAHLTENVFTKGEGGSELLFATLAREHEPVALSHRHINHREEHP